MGMGVRLKELRTKKGESLQQTANAAGTSKAHIWQMERGQADNPSVGVIKNLADHFGVTISFLVGEDLDASDADPELAGMFRQASDFTETERDILRGMMETLKAASAKRRSADS